MTVAGEARRGEWTTTTNTRPTLHIHLDADWRAPAPEYTPQTPLASICCTTCCAVLLYDKSAANRKSTANPVHSRSVVRHMSASIRRPATHPQHPDMSRCAACCTTCCPADPQRNDVVEFGPIAAAEISFVRSFVSTSSLIWSMTGDARSSTNSPVIEPVLHRLCRRHMPSSMPAAIDLMLVHTECVIDARNLHWDYW